MRIHRGLTVVITLLAAIAVAMQVDLSGLLAAMERGFGRETIFAFFCILLNFYLSFVRFRYSFRALGIGVPGGQAARAFVLGHLGNQLIFSVVGQAVGRSAVLAGAGVSPSAITFLSFLERMIALGSLLLFALAGGAYTLGRIVFDVEGGGGYLAYFVLSLIAVVLLYGLANRRQLRRLLAQLSGQLAWPVLAGCFLLSVVAHCAMLGAFYAQFSAYGEPVPTVAALAALSVVMFLAALPISFAGWGIRELSAAHVLGALGVPAVVGAAVGVAIGLLSLVLVIGCLIAVPFMTIRPKPVTASAPAPQIVASRNDIDRLFAALAAFLLPVAVVFQLRVPMPSHWLNVNLADLLAVSASAVLALTWGWTRPLISPARWVVPPLALLSAAIGLSLTIGYVNHGFLSWAFVNRTMGWFVILSYFGVGFLLWAHSGRARLLRAVHLAVSAVSIVAALQIVLYLAGSYTALVPAGINLVRLEGYLADSNAFAFQCVIAFIAFFCLRAMAAVSGHRMGIHLAPAVLVAAVVLAQSRTGWVLMGTAVVLTAFWMPAVRRELALSIVTGLAFIAAIPLVEMIVTAAMSLLASTGGVSGAGGGGGDAGGALVQTFAQGMQRGYADSERWETVWRGLELWREAPVFGHGLGGFIHDRLVQGKSSQVIHNVPVWVLAEMGLVGFVMFAAALLLFVRGLVLQRTAPGAALPVNAALICLAAFCLGGLTQDFFYQRLFWFVLGLMVPLACSAPRQPAVGVPAPRPT
ncbi:lysylphosphatidylglycerol synthase transmembrane domain-containing protein [Chelatococcus sp. XZ-Ab1]|uniref:lysylphosphatidylglycerol synthase transmembrane domain-containing protein n=1 Tax=Chelatococcus sp. XZ-Ab1 TaxID=3034027 RepID=UPI0023E3598C|nr:lysylphosphatidylglycerol synthase transmembrane domain-containing protein [Chelatococcus sp. XZ-Ab1]